MKTLNAVYFLAASLALSIFISGGVIHAQPKPSTSSTIAAGGVGTGGGDACERRVREIQANFVEWIDRGDFRTLKLPNHFTHDQYAKDMKDSLLSAVKISCPSRKEGEESAVMYHGKPKTCMFDSRSKPVQVTCDIERLLKQTDEEEQYRLIHHEHAGLIKLEPANYDESSYFVSNQIAAYLANFKRLTVLQIVKEPKVYLSSLEAKMRDTNLKVIGTFGGNHIFKGVKETHDGHSLIRIDQVFDGSKWEKYEEKFLSSSDAQVVDKRTVRLLRENNPVLSEFVLPAIIDNFPKGTQVRGWHISSVFGEFIFAEEIFKDGKGWEKLEQMGFIKIPKH